MTWRTHLAGGLASLAVIPFAPSSTSLALGCVFAALGSLLPDLDARESKLSNVQIVGVAPLKPLAWVVSRRLGHRGPLHSLLALLVVTVGISLPLSLFLDPLAGIGLSLGFASHILLDACTKSGVPLRWPELGRVRLLPPRLRFTTGSMAEDILFLLLALLAVTYFVQSGTARFPTP